MNAIINEPISNRDPRLGREHIEPPEVKVWTDHDERDYAAWLESCRAEMEHEFALDRDDAFDEFCRDRFEDECL